MFEDQALDVLNYVQAAQNRRFDTPESQAAWVDALLPLDYVEAMSAARWLFANTTDWITPGAIAQRVRAARQESRPSLPPAPPGLNAAEYVAWRKSALAAARDRDRRTLPTAVAYDALSGPSPITVIDPGDVTPGLA